MDRIQVTVRARPLLQEDAKSSPWKISGNSIFIPNQSSKFEFDRVFGEECKTVEVYEVRTREIVAAAVRGFNGTVFAYGQTNSGKTHTMRGSATEPGVIPLAVRDLFDIIHEDADREFLLRMSYMEIYNEEINDLLSPEHRKLQIHESLERGIFVAGLREEIVASPQQVLDLMQFGESHRHIGETNMNLYSSRSHTIFRMIIESRERTEDEDASHSCDAVRVSVLNLVDLAGSERAAKTGAEGVRLKEGSHINKSLMTLGTVIKKLSEGAESQGGHVPYRDSKLTRILQPALGGNANTAIICNITLAQIHADETKSSLQFASRALRVTNCAHVNEILTDAALLKRQKKEIEELRAKLQDSHSEHLEEEILNLRNTLLQSELERERIALELEEEKRAQAAREKVLQEQAKKIENLSSMVLYSSRDEKRDQYKKGKRRETWCPGKLSRETLQEVDTTVQSRASVVNPMRASRDVGPLLPFEELLGDTGDGANILQQDENCSNINGSEGSAPLDPCAFLCITNRRKQPTKRKSLPVEDHGLEEMQAEYEELFLKSETQRIMSDVQIDRLRRRLVNPDVLQCMNSNCCATYDGHKSTTYVDKNASLRETDAILVIKQLQEKIEMLEMDTSSSQQNLESVYELATEQNKCAIEKLEELQKELQISREEARVAREQLASSESARNDVNDDSAIRLSLEMEGIISELQSSTTVIEDVSLLLDELFQSFSALFNVFNDFNASMRQNSSDQKLIVANHEKLHFLIKQRVTEVENEKLLLYNQSVDLQKQIEELSHGTKKYEDSLKALSEKHELEKADFLSEIEILEKEISCLSFNSLAKEKESMRKDLEKTKMKLKETESKLKNAIQEKTKLEGEKSFAEREVKRLQGQKTLLERDISKRDSLAGRRRDSVIERNPKGYDGKRPKGLAATFEQTMQEDYKKLEVLVFEMEATIASLEEELAAAEKVKEDAISRNESLASELEAMCEKLEISNTELDILRQEVSSLKLRLEDSTFEQKKIESSIKLLLEEKEELSTQLTESLLEIEEEKAIWLAKEKASIEAIEEKTKSCNADIEMLSKAMSEVNSELESCRKECKFLREKLSCSEENVKLEKKCSAEKSAEIDQLKREMEIAAAENMQSQEILKSNFEGSSVDLHHARMKINELEKELSVLNKDRENLLSRVEEFATGFESQNNIQSKARVEELSRVIPNMEAKVQKDEVNHGIEKAKLRMRLRGTQAKLDAFRFRHKELADECDHMNRRFEEASRKLKDQLASSAIETLNLKKQLAAARG